MEVPFFFVIAKVIVANLAAFGSSTFMWDFSSPKSMGHLLFSLSMMLPKPGLTYLNLLSVALWEKLRTSQLYRPILCIHQCSSSFAYFDRLNCTSIFLLNCPYIASQLSLNCPSKIPLEIIP